MKASQLIEWLGTLPPDADISIDADEGYTGLVEVGGEKYGDFQLCDDGVEFERYIGPVHGPKNKFESDMADRLGASMAAFSAEMIRQVKDNLAFLRGDVWDGEISSKTGETITFKKLPPFVPCQDS